MTLTRPIHKGVSRLLASIGLVHGPQFVLCAASLLLLPQFDLPLLGARIGRTYRFRGMIIVERRTIPGPEPGPTSERLVSNVI